MDRVGRIYGGLHVVFCGDMRQLEPCADEDKIYEVPLPEFTDYVDVFIELKGMHRFSDDPRYGQFLMNLRDGYVDEEYIQEKINNDRVVTDESQIPDDIKYATYFNKDRAAINAGCLKIDLGLFMNKLVVQHQ